MEIQKIEGLPPELAERIAPLFSDSEWRVMADQIRGGSAELFSINDGESVAVTRIEPDLQELCVCAYEGKDVMGFARELVKAAKKSGALTLRYHTKHKGMQRLLAELGPTEVETVYTVALQ